MNALEGPTIDLDTRDRTEWHETNNFTFFVTMQPIHLKTYTYLNYTTWIN